VAVEVVSNGAYAAFDRRKPPEYRPGDGHDRSRSMNLTIYTRIKRKRRKSGDSEFRRVITLPAE